MANSVNPESVLFPEGWVDEVEVLFDDKCFSIAKITKGKWKNGTGIRWSGAPGTSSCPTGRHGNPLWFMLPGNNEARKKLIEVLETLITEDK
ncbi:hypothetical protein FAI41_08295 [Acetobacteraceae bacterium]|nr:hypothetical protein FAI41_08295 [Acetobacteraceae bacterium]